MVGIRDSKELTTIAVKLLSLNKPNKVKSPKNKVRDKEYTDISNK